MQDPCITCVHPVYNLWISTWVHLSLWSFAGCVLSCVLSFQTSALVRSVLSFYVLSCPCNVTAWPAQPVALFSLVSALCYWPCLVVPLCCPCNVTERLGWCSTGKVSKGKRLSCRTAPSSSLVQPCNVRHCLVYTCRHPSKGKA